MEHRCVRFYILATIYLLALFATSSTQSNDCCSTHTMVRYEELSVTPNFRTYLIGPNEWELSVNITWIPVEDYNAYDVEFNLASSLPVHHDVFSCFYDPQCSAGNESTSMDSWREFKKLQFGSTYKITMYISEVADNVRGNHLTGFAVSPDCYEETRSIEFCIKQPVGYVGKPFNIALSNIKRFDRTKVLVSITWRQPIHANPEITLAYYTIAWSTKVFDTFQYERMKLENVTYQAGEYMTTELNKPLAIDTTYTLTISPTVIVDGVFTVKGEAQTLFTTQILPADTDLKMMGYPDDTNGSNVFAVSILCIIQCFLLKWMI